MGKRVFVLVFAVFAASLFALIGQNLTDGALDHVEPSGQMFGVVAFVLAGAAVAYALGNVLFRPKA